MLYERLFLERHKTHVSPPQKGDPQTAQCTNCSQVQLNKSLSIIGANNRSLGYRLLVRANTTQKHRCHQKVHSQTHKSSTDEKFPPYSSAGQNVFPSCCLLFLNTEEEPFRLLQDPTFPNMFVYALPPPQSHDLLGSLLEIMF